THNQTPTIVSPIVPTDTSNSRLTITPRRKTKFWILSDLHQEFSSCTWNPSPADIPEHDALILAGDTHSPATDSIIFAERLTDKPVFMVCGNHEFYGTVMKDELARAKKCAAESPNVTLLENDVVTFNDVRILGCTLWTDFELFGQNSLRRAIYDAGKGMNDYRRIKRISATSGRTRPITPQETLDAHRASAQFLETELGRSEGGNNQPRTIVITHHAPHPNGLNPSSKTDPLSVAYASDLTAMIETHQPDLWVFGHTHTACNFTIGKTRLISNARGYVGHERQNPSFNPWLVIEV
ncbi:MAG: metallophosphoesterase, partial [Notoacmeibacter sp.]